MVVTIVGLLVVGCLQTELRAGARPQDPATLFTTLEARLRDAALVELTCVVVVATGAVSASLEGTLVIEPGNVVALGFTGSLFGEDVDLRLESDGERLIGEAGGTTFDQAASPALVEALLVGFTRMGILHNLAMLSGGQLPDHADGGVADWAQVSDFQLDENRGRDRNLVRFLLTVGGEPAGEVGLVIDAETGEPLQRSQRVHFPEGDMLVLESYEVRIESEVEPAEGPAPPLKPDPPPGG